MLRKQPLRRDEQVASSWDATYTIVGDEASFKPLVGFDVPNTGDNPIESHSEYTVDVFPVILDE